MHCKHPKEVWKDVQTGQPKFSRPTNGRPFVPMKLPCGLCINCRINWQTERKLRLVHESYYYDSSYFFTWTQDDEHIDEDHNLNYRDLKLFIGRLRERNRRAGKENIRYAICGEYGSHTSRPHYHGIIYGLEIPDQVLSGRNARGENYYQSELIDELWGRGQVIFAPANDTTCGYVASYMAKDATGNYCKVDENGKPQPYTTLVVDKETGESRRVERTKPFMRLSTGGEYRGLGYRYFQDNKHHIIREGYVFERTSGVMGAIKRKVNFKAHPIPRYYLDLIKDDPDPKISSQYERIRQMRLDAQLDPQYRANNTPDRLHAKEVISRKRLSLSTRGQDKAAKQQHEAVIDQDGKSLLKAPEKQPGPDLLQKIDRS